MGLFDVLQDLFGIEIKKKAGKKRRKKTKKAKSKAAKRKTKTRTKRAPKKKTKKITKKAIKRKPKRKPKKKAVRRTSKKKRKPARKIPKRKSPAPPKRPSGTPQEKEIGVITHYFGKISVGIIKLKSELIVGDKIHIKGAHDDFTQLVSSMQLNHKEVLRAKKGSEVGIRVNQRVHENDKVYKV